MAAFGFKLFFVVMAGDGYDQDLYDVFMHQVDEAVLFVDAA